MKPITSLSGLLAALLFVLPLHTALAQDKSKPVSRDELRACMDSESQLAERRQAMEARRQARRTEDEALKAEAAALADEQKGIDPTNGMRVDRFQRKVKAYDTRVIAANEARAVLTRDLTALGADLEGYNAKCGGITFLAEDKAAILKEREAAGKK